MSNGGLEVVKGSHNMAIPLDKDLCIPSKWVRNNYWTPVELEPGNVKQQLG